MGSARIQKAQGSILFNDANEVCGGFGLRNETSRSPGRKYDSPPSLSGFSSAVSEDVYFVFIGPI